MCPGVSNRSVPDNHFASSSTTRIPMTLSKKSCSPPAKLRTGRVIVVFGCGGERDRTKRPVMGAVAARDSDYAIVTSDNPRSEDPLAIIQEIEEGMKGSSLCRDLRSPGSHPCGAGIGERRRHRPDRRQRT